MNYCIILSMETTIKDLVKKYGQQIGETDSRVSFLHSETAMAAAAELQQMSFQYTDIVGYNFIYRLSQVLYDGRYKAAVGHSARDCYWFNPIALK